MTIQGLINDKWEYYGKRWPENEFPKNFTIKKCAEDHHSGTNAEYAFSVFNGTPGHYRYSSNIGNGDVNYEDQKWLAAYYSLPAPPKPITIDEFSII